MRLEIPGVGIKYVEVKRKKGLSAGPCPRFCRIRQLQLPEVEGSWWVSYKGSGGQEKEFHMVGLSIISHHPIKLSSLLFSQPLQ